MCFNSFYFPCSSLAVGLYVLYLKMFFLKSIMIIIWHPWLPWVSSTVHEDTKVPPPIPVTTFLVKNVSAGFQNINLTALVFLTIALQSLIPDPWVSGTGSDTALFVAEGVLMTFARLMIMWWQFWLLSGSLMMPGMSPDLVTSSSWLGHEEVDWIGGDKNQQIELSAGQVTLVVTQKWSSQTCSNPRYQWPDPEDIGRPPGGDPTRAQGSGNQARSHLDQAPIQQSRPGCWHEQTLFQDPEPSVPLNPARISCCD